MQTLSANFLLIIPIYLTKDSVDVGKEMFEIDRYIDSELAVNIT